MHGEHRGDGRRKNHKGRTVAKLSPTNLAECARTQLRPSGSARRGNRSPDCAGGEQSRPQRAGTLRIGRGGRRARNPPTRTWQSLLVPPNAEVIEGAYKMKCSTVSADISRPVMVIELSAEVVMTTSFPTWRASPPFRSDRFRSVIDRTPSTIDRSIRSPA